MSFRFILKFQDSNWKTKGFLRQYQKKLTNLIEILEINIR